MGAPLLVDLRERRLDEGRGAAERGNDPHPENRAGTAESHGGGDARDVTDADARGRGNHQRAEGGHAAFLLRGLHDDAERFDKHAQRKRASEEKEEEANRDQKRDEQVRIHEA